MARTPSYDRNAALDAAMDLFWAKGYYATSLKDLELALQMKPGSIYAAFSSKQALFLASLERYFQSMRDGLRADIEQAGSPLQGLAAALRSMGQTDGGPCHACMLVKTVLGTTDMDTEIADQARFYLDRMQAEFRAAFEDARGRGELPDDADPSRLARRYQSNFMALQIELQRGTRPADIAELAEDMAQETERLCVDA
ncbi:TetR/AcrR family transcriptional regulator [Henriciella sp.]|uniref:TetR/AcrR family transcriptional regulator n=1 Tax=Henriciella sp. TaxID=1968823 RepID=UPI00261EE940|nr:TetR/AcrR family transcriptional regulator [Henriciella sp.]